MTGHHDFGLDRLRHGLTAAGWEQPERGCPTHDELWASAVGALDQEADERILLHLARCSRCAAAWQLAREMTRTGNEEAQPAVPIPPKRNAPPWRRPAFLAAAAALVIGLGLAAGMLLHHSSSLTPVYRQQQEPAVTISATHAMTVLPRTMCHLRWSAGPPGTRYDVVVTDENLDILSTVKNLTAPDYLVPAEKIPRSVSTILWRVTAHLPDHRTVVSTTFTTAVENAGGS